jgi:hypothetical protein
MSDETEEVTDATETEETTEEQQEQQQVDPEIEAKARSMGWVPEDEFKGDKSKWRPADEFVQRGEEVIGFIKKDRDKAQAELKEVKDRLAKAETDYSTRLERMERMNSIALDQAREQIKRDFSVRKRAAVRDGDEDAFNQLEAEQDAAIADLEKKSAPPEKPNGEDKSEKIPPEIQEKLDTWRADNRWFDTDMEMQKVATAYHGYLMEAQPGLTLEENLEEVREHVKNKFPSRFSSKAPNGSQRGSPVEGGGRSEGASGKKSLWSQVPDDDKPIAIKQMADGAFKRDADGNEFKTDAARREEWARVYFGGNP